MHHFKEIIHFLDYTFAIVWGFTVYDLAVAVNTGVVLSTLDGIIKILFALVGLFFFIIRGHHFYLDKKLDRDIKRETLEKLQKENDKI